MSRCTYVRGNVILSFFPLTAFSLSLWLFVILPSYTVFIQSLAVSAMSVWVFKCPYLSCHLSAYIPSISLCPPLGPSISLLSICRSINLFIRSYCCYWSSIFFVSLPLFRFLFGLFKQAVQFLQHIKVKTCQSGMQCWDLNPQPSCMQVPSNNH